MIFYFNLFNYRVEKECANMFEAYDHLMKLIEDFNIDMATAKECYTVGSYASTFGIKPEIARLVWGGGDKKKTTLRHCNFELKELGIKTHHHKMTKLQKSNLRNIIIHGWKATRRVEDYVKRIEEKIVEKGGVNNVHAS